MSAGLALRGIAQSDAWTPPRLPPRLGPLTRRLLHADRALLFELAGGIDLLGAPGKPSSTQKWESIVEAKPDVLFIACCGFRIERALEDVQKISQTDAWRQLPAVKNGRVYVTDGNAYFSSPGPRLIDGLEIMAHALHPQLHVRPPVGACHIV